jgi:hypothetical protein
MDVTDQPQASVSEIKITMIAGVIHYWVFWPGKWEPYSPQPGDLLRVWEDPLKVVCKLK